MPFDDDELSLEEPFPRDYDVRLIADFPNSSAVARFDFGPGPILRKSCPGENPYVISVPYCDLGDFRLTTFPGNALLALPAGLERRAPSGHLTSYRSKSSGAIASTVFADAARCSSRTLMGYFRRGRRQLTSVDKIREIVSAPVNEGSTPFRLTRVLFE